MAEITDEYMREMLSKTKTYSIVILKAGPNKNIEGANGIKWEHGRRNFSLKAEGLLPVVCPVTSEGETAGIGIFDADAEKVKQIMDDDIGVKAGLFVYEILTCRSFPGSCLPY